MIKKLRLCSRRIIVLNTHGFLIILFFFQFFIPLNILYAEDALEMKDSSSFTTDEIRVISTRLPKDKLNQPQSIFTISQEELNKKNITALPEAFEENPEISMQRTTLGGGAPILRGLIGQYNLILIDGVRLNNSTYRSGPIQYFNTIDPNIVESIEVIEGPGSMLYGSDAIGGIISITTKKPDNKNSYFFKSKTQLSSAYNSISQNLLLNFSTKKLGLLALGTYKRLNDLKAGGNIGTQKPTGYYEWDGMLDFSYTINDNSCLNLSLQTNNQYDVPRYDRIIAGKDILNFYTPQKRHLANLSYLQNLENSFISNVQVNISFNQQIEGNAIISKKTPNLKIADLINTSTPGFSFTLNTASFTNNHLTFGYDFYLDKIQSSRDSIFLDKNIAKETAPLYPNSPEYMSNGIFLQDNINFERLSIILGLRYSLYNLKTYENKFPTAIDASTSSLCGNVALSYNLIPEKLNCYLNVSQGFRAPNANDLIATGNISNYGTEVANPDLNPEKCLNYEIGLKFNFEKFKANLSGYYLNIYDLITREKQFINGTFYVFKKVNSSNARVFGYEINLSYNFITDFFVKAGFCWTSGDDLSKNEPLSRIPPARASLSFDYQKDNYWLSLNFLASTSQKRLSSLDKEDTRIGVNGTSEFFVSNFRAGYKLGNLLNFNFDVENIFDVPYKIHGSGIWSPGRNVFVGIELTI